MRSLRWSLLRSVSLPSCSSVLLATVFGRFVSVGVGFCFLTAERLIAGGEIELLHCRSGLAHWLDDARDNLEQQRSGTSAIFVCADVDFDVSEENMYRDFNTANSNGVKLEDHVKRMTYRAVWNSRGVTPAAETGV